MSSGESNKFEYGLDNVEFTQIPDNVAVTEGVVVLSGGHDRQGRPIITFPIDMNLKIQMSQVGFTEVVDALVYYWEVIRTPDKAAGISILVDFRAGSVTIMNTIINSINIFKSRYPQSVGSVYIVQPQDRDQCNQLKIQLGHKKLKKISKLFFRPAPVNYPAQFQSILVKTSSNLIIYIEHDLLTNEFGGTLCYDHQIWLLLRKDINKYLENVLRIKANFLDAENNIRLLKKYENTESSFMEEEALNWIRRRFNEIISKSEVEDLFPETDDILSELSTSSTGIGSSKYAALKGNPHIDNNRLFLHAIRGKLVEIQNFYQSLLSEAERKISFAKNFKEVEKFSGDATKWIQNVGTPELKVPPNIASSLDEAESVARNFHNNMFIPGMKSISKCNDICKTLEKTSYVEDSGDIAIKRSQYLHNILSNVTTFNYDLQNRRKLYSDVYQFFLILNRVITWVKRTTKFLPIGLISYHENMNDSEPLPFGSAWNTKIRQYLLKHPTPKVDQIDLIEKLTPMMKEINVRNEARLLVYRVRLLIKLLSGNDVIVADVREVIEWKERLEADLEIQNQFKEINEEEITKSTSSLFVKLDGETLNIIPKEKDVAQENIVSSKSSLYHKISKTNPSKIKTSPHYNKSLSKGLANNIVASKSQPKLNVKYEDEEENLRRKELIHLAEQTVKDSLEDTHLISERDIRIPRKMKDEEELSLILNQLLYDINSQKDSLSQNSSRHPSSLQDLNYLRPSQNNGDYKAAHYRKNENYF